MGWVLPLHRCAHVKWESVMGSSGCRPDRGRASTTTICLPALRRHYRVCPQWLVVGIPAVPVGSRWRRARGKSASDEHGGGCASGCDSRPPRRRSRRVPGVGDRSELRAVGPGTRSFGRVSRAESAATEVAAGSPTCPGAGRLARVFARTASAGHPGVPGRRVPR